jgi:hypothetical protein
MPRASAPNGDRHLVDQSSHLARARNWPRWDESVDSEELISEPIGVGSTVLTKVGSMGRDYQHT